MRLVPSFPPASCDFHYDATCYPVMTEDRLFSDAQMDALNSRNHFGSGGSTYTCPPRIVEVPPPDVQCPPPPPPQPPPAASIMDCDSNSCQPNRWYDVTALAERGPSGQHVGDCNAWCTMRADHNCEVRAAILFGEKVRCGFDATATQCAIFAGDTLTPTSPAAPPCALPAVCGYSLIVKEDAFVASATHGGAFAIGGTLFDETPSAAATVSGHSHVNSITPAASGNFAFAGGVTTGQVRAR